MVVVGAGTGGTVVGIGHKFKENMPNVQVWGEGRGEEEEGGRRYMYSGAENGREGEKKNERKEEGRRGRGWVTSSRRRFRLKTRGGVV